MFLKGHCTNEVYVGKLFQVLLPKMPPEKSSNIILGGLLLKASFRGTSVLQNNTEKENDGCYHQSVVSKPSASFFAHS